MQARWKVKHLTLPKSHIKDMDSRISQFQGPDGEDNTRDKATTAALLLIH